MGLLWCELILILFCVNLFCVNKKKQKDRSCETKKKVASRDGETGATPFAL